MPERSFEPSSALREAVAACTRALANDPDAAAAGSSAELHVATLRAAGDRAAVRRRFHDPSCHTVHRPANAAAAALFDALEAARLDAIGMRWMPGVAVNVQADAGDDDTLIRWLAFEIFTERGAPPSVSARVDAARGTMPAAFALGLTDLRALIASQPAFARVAATWAGSVWADPWLATMSPDIPARGRNAIGAADTAAPTVASRPRGNRTDNQSARERSAYRSGQQGSAIDSSTPPRRYAVYTSAFDRVIAAMALTDSEDLATLRTRLDAEFGETRRTVTQLANRLRQMLLARQTRHWRFDLDEGQLDGRRLAGVIAAPANARPFKQEAEVDLPSAAVTVLLDCSGSMKGRPIIIAALTVEIMVQALERCGITCEVLGFTTRDWGGGRSYEAWSMDGAPPDPGRLNALEHIVIKSAEVPWRRARRGLGVVMRDDLLKENVDGEAVQWAHARLAKRREHRKLLLVISDGEPHDEATERANGGAYLARHLRDVVEQIEEESTVEIAAIGVGHDALRFYSRAASIVSADELAAALNVFLCDFFSRSAR